MTVDTTAQTEQAVETVQAPRPNLRKPTARDVIRGFGTIYGPPLLLDLLVAASVGTLVRQALGGPISCAAERRFRPIAILGVGMAATYLLALRPWLRRWGATDDEVARALPGDELVPDPAIDSTWSVTIDAPAEDVWPWLAQIGQDRGGFYSYEWLENLAGPRAAERGPDPSRVAGPCGRRDRAASPDMRPPAGALRARTCAGARRLGVVRCRADR